MASGTLRLVRSVSGSIATTALLAWVPIQISFSLTASGPGELVSLTEPTVAPELGSSTASDWLDSTIGLELSPSSERAITTAATRRHRRDANQGRTRDRATLPRRVGCGATVEAWSVERSVVAKDRELKLLQLGPWFEAGILNETGTALVIAIESVPLPAAAVEREHQLATHPLSIGVLAHQLLELGHERSRATHREPCFRPILDDLEPKLLQPPARVSPGGHELELRERRSAPERERAVE